jgi:hypothetical protein
MRILMLSCLALTALVLFLAGCSTAYWSRPGSELPDLASESHACYASAIGGESPAAFPAQSPRGSARLLPSTEPPPQLWERSPRQAGFARFEEQQRYERCMQQRGWRATRS